VVVVVFLRQRTCVIILALTTHCYDQRAVL